MVKPERSDPKSIKLRESATLNPHPERVSAALFQLHAFFDPRDLVQVKYEMLRQVNREGVQVKTAAAAFGFSRMTFYQVNERFVAEGLSGLLPQPKGPRRAHKLSELVVQELLGILQDEPSLRVDALQQRLFQQCGLWVHQRSIERALVRNRKKARPCKQAQRERIVPPQHCCKPMRRCAARSWTPPMPPILLHRNGCCWNNRAWLPGCSSSRIGSPGSQWKARRHPQNSCWH